MARIYLHHENLCLAIMFICCYKTPPLATTFSIFTKYSSLKPCFLEVQQLTDLNRTTLKI